jgi:T5SS/PEP-CTERM-associated repeat protein
VLRELSITTPHRLQHKIRRARYLLQLPWHDVLSQSPQMWLHLLPETFRSRRCRRLALFAEFSGLPSKSFQVTTPAGDVLLCYDGAGAKFQGRGLSSFRCNFVRHQTAYSVPLFLLATVCAGADPPEMASGAFESLFYSAHRYGYHVTKGGSAFPIIEHDDVALNAGVDSQWKVALINKQAIDIRLVTPDELKYRGGGFNLSDIASLFRNARRWARNQGYLTGFPVFNPPQGEAEKHILVCFKPRSGVREMDAPLKELNFLQKGANRDPARLARAAFLWGRNQTGDAAALPNFEEGVNVTGMTLFTDKILKIQSVTSTDLVTAAEPELSALWINDRYSRGYFEKWLDESMSPRDQPGRSISVHDFRAGFDTRNCVWSGPVSVAKPLADIQASDEFAEFGVAENWRGGTPARSARAIFDSIDQRVALRPKEGGIESERWLIRSGAVDLHLTHACRLSDVGQDYERPTLDVSESDTQENGASLRLFGNGGDLRVQGACIVGNQPGSAGTVVLGATSFAPAGKLVNSNLWVGHEGTGIVRIEQGGHFNTEGHANLGFKVGSQGMVVVDGAESKFVTKNFLFIGRNGRGELTIRNGGLATAQDTFISYFAGSLGTITVEGAGSKLQTAINTRIGGKSTATLTIRDGGCAASGAVIFADGEKSAGRGIVDGSGSRLDAVTANYIGFLGAGQLTLRNGGQTAANAVLLGRKPGSSGSLVVDGEGSLCSSVDLIVGSQGTGNLTVQNAGQAIADFVRWGDGAGSHGAATVDGAGSLLTARKRALIGRYGSNSMAVRNGGRVLADSAYLACLPRSQAEVIVDGEGSSLESTNFLSVGYAGTASLTVKNGARTTSRTTYIAASPEIKGAIRVDGIGSEMASGNILVGSFGHGTLNLTDAGHAASQNVYIGFNAGSQGSVTVEGDHTRLDSANDLVVGIHGAGTLSIQNGAQVSGRDMAIAHYPGSQGHVTIAGTGALLQVGGLRGGNEHSEAELKIESGGTVIVGDQQSGHKADARFEWNGRLINDGIFQYHGGESRLGSQTRLSGVGTYVASLIFAHGAALSPGDERIGTCRLHGDQVFGPGGRITCQVCQSTDKSQSSDIVEINGALTLTATADVPFEIDITSLSGNGAPRISPARGEWPLITATDIHDFDPSQFRILDASQKKASTGEWSVIRRGQTLFLVFLPRHHSSLNLSVSVLPFFGLALFFLALLAAAHRRIIKRSGRKN